MTLEDEDDAARAVTLEEICHHLYVEGVPVDDWPYQLGPALRELWLSLLPKGTRTMELGELRERLADKSKSTLLRRIATSQFVIDLYEPHNPDKGPSNLPEQAVLLPSASIPISRYVSSGHGGPPDRVATALRHGARSLIASMFDMPGGPRLATPFELSARLGASYVLELVLCMYAVEPPAKE